MLISTTKCHIITNNEESVDIAHKDSNGKTKSNEIGHKKEITREGFEGIDQSFNFLNDKHLVSHPKIELVCFTGIPEFHY
jgi:hypothetical protein